MRFHSTAALFSVVLLTAFASPHVTSGPFLSDPLAASIDSLIDRRVALDSFSGTVLVARDGRVVYQRAAGVANRETTMPMAIDTRLQIASTTKLFTSIAIRQLEQAGMLSFSDTVGKFLPTYPNSLVRSKVTVDQLLRHRSGIGSFWNEKFMARRANIRTVNDYLDLFQGDSLLFEPGTSEAYSNGGYVVLGAIIEKVSGMSYDDYLKDRIFRPATMTETSPYDRTAPPRNAAVGYTTQDLAGPLPGDRRLAGPASPPATVATPAAGVRLRILGPDGRELSPEAAREAVARRSVEHRPRRPNTAYQPGRSGPAGDHYSTVGDFLKLADALTSYRLLDSVHTAALLGTRYAGGTDFRANGGGPGVNAEFSIFPSGLVLVVLSNYDPPAATTVAQLIRERLASPVQSSPLKAEVDSLHSAMVAAYKADPVSVARFYTENAQVIGMGMRFSGPAQVESYWSQSPTGGAWTLEAVEVGGSRDAPWVLGRSTLVAQGGQRMVTDFLAVLARGPDGKLRYRIDLFTPTDRPVMRMR